MAFKVKTTTIRAGEDGFARIRVEELDPGDTTRVHTRLLASKSELTFTSGSAKFVLSECDDIIIGYSPLSLV
jgi:hypothetical protein